MCHCAGAVPCFSPCAAPPHHPSCLHRQQPAGALTIHCTFARPLPFLSLSTPILCFPNLQVPSPSFAALAGPRRAFSTCHSIPSMQSPLHPQPAGTLSIHCNFATPLPFLCLSLSPPSSPLSPTNPRRCPQCPLQLARPLPFLSLINLVSFSHQPTNPRRCPQRPLQLCGTGGAGDGARQGKERSVCAHCMQASWCTQGIGMCCSM